MQSVYALGDPRTNEIRYIGIAKDVYRRYAQHLNNPHRNEAKNKWLEEIKQAGIVPTLTVLEADVEDNVIYERERHWIRHYLALEMQLTNASCTYELASTPLTHTSLLRLRIKEVAESKGYNMSSLSRASNVSFRTIKRIFREPHYNISIDILGKIAKVLGVNPGELIEMMPE